MSTVRCPNCKQYVQRRGLGSHRGSRRCEAAAARLKLSSASLERLEELADAASDEAEAIPVHHRPATASSLDADANIAAVLGAEMDDAYRSDPESAAAQGPRPKLQARRPKGPKSAPAAVRSQPASTLPAHVRLQLYQGHMKPKVPQAQWPCKQVPLNTDAQDQLPSLLELQDIIRSDPFFKEGDSFDIRAPQGTDTISISSTEDLHNVFQTSRTIPKLLVFPKSLEAPQPSKPSAPPAALKPAAPAHAVIRLKNQYFDPYSARSKAPGPQKPAALPQLQVTPQANADGDEAELDQTALDAELHLPSVESVMNLSSLHPGTNEMQQVRRCSLALPRLGRCAKVIM